VAIKSEQRFPSRKKVPKLIDQILQLVARVQELETFLISSLLFAAAIKFHLKVMKFFTAYTWLCAPTACAERLVISSERALPRA
jgi:hypothetical protein